MLLAVVLDGQLQFLPSHVEVVLPAPSGLSTGICVCGRGKPGANQQQPQPRLLRRLRARVDEIEHRLEPTQTPRTADADRATRIDRSAVKPVRVAERIESGDCVVDGDRAAPRSKPYVPAW